MMVISINKRRYNIVLSRRAYLEAELAQKRSETIKPTEKTEEALPVAEEVPLDVEADGATQCESINSTDTKPIGRSS